MGASVATNDSTTSHRKSRASLKELTSGFLPDAAAAPDAREYVSSMDTWRKSLTHARVKLMNKRREALLKEFRGY